MRLAHRDSFGRVAVVGGRLDIAHGPRPRLEASESAAPQRSGPSSLMKLLRC